MNSKNIILIVVALAVIIGAGAYIAISGDDAPDESSKDIEGVQLTVFGNANGDSRVDSRDITAIEDLMEKGDEGIVISDAMKKSHILADANQDGKVDATDKELVKKIVDGKATNLYILDCYGNYAKVPVNPQRIVCEFYCNAEILQMVGAEKNIVAVDNAMKSLQEFYLQGADLKKVEAIGSLGMPDYERIAELTPDLWLVHGNMVPYKQPKSEAPVIGLDLTNLDMKDIHKSGLIRGSLLAGYIFNNVEAAEKYVDWVIDTWQMLYDKTSVLKEDEKPKVLYIGYDRYVTDQENNKVRSWVPGSTMYEAIKLAGAHNMLDDFDFDVGSSATTEIDLEAVIGSEYEYLFVHAIKFMGNGKVNPDAPMHGYTTDDPTEWNDAHKKVSELFPFDKVGLDKIYMSAGDFMSNASGGLLNAILVASVIHPDLFPELDMMEMHQQYVDLLGYDFDLSKHGVFMKTI